MPLRADELAEHGDDGLAVYDPGSGVVQPLRTDELVGHRLGIGGWAVPWFLVEPTPG